MSRRKNFSGLSGSYVSITADTAGQKEMSEYFAQLDTPVQDLSDAEYIEWILFSSGDEVARNEALILREERLNRVFYPFG